VLLERKREVPYYLMLAVEQQDRELARAEMETDGFIGRAPDRDVAIVAGDAGPSMISSTKCLRAGPAPPTVVSLGRRRATLSSEGNGTNGVD